MVDQVTSDRIAVFHLVRQSNDIKMFRDFIHSYETFDAQIEHQLVIIFKGFSSDSELLEYKALLKQIPHKTFSVTDEGFDITAYIKASKFFAKDYDYFCFLNSHALLLAEGWLTKLFSSLQQSNVGLVGATGSWQSLRGADGTGAIVLSAINYSVKALFNNMPMREKYYEIKDVLLHALFLRHFARFPNAHVRTNAFMLSSQLMLENGNHNVLTKNDAYQFESGKRGLSSSIIVKGLKLRIVGADGKSYDESEWPDSNVYMQGTQDNLLVSDNMTRKFMHRTGSLRTRLWELAWTPQNLFNKEKDWLRIVNKRKYEGKIIKQKMRLKKLDNSGITLIIYGANELGEHFHEWITKHTRNIKVIGFADTYLTGEKAGLTVYSPSDLNTQQLDHDFILISSNAFYQEIYETLLDSDISPSKII